MGVTLGLNGATTGPGADLLTDIRVAGAAGFDFVELRDDKLEAHLRGGGTLEGVREALAAARLGCASLNALEDATLPAAGRREERLARWDTLCGWARAIGADVVIAVPSPEPAGTSAREVTRRTREALDTLAEAAQRHGVRTGFEFLGFDWCSVRSLRHAVAVVEGCRTPGIGLVVDVFHCHAGGVAPAELGTLDPRRLMLVHLDDVADRPPAALQDADRVLPGEGVVPLGAMLGALAGTGYRGGYSVELFRPEYWAWDPETLARRAHEAARHVLSAAGAS